MKDREAPESNRHAPAPDRKRMDEQPASLRRFVIALWIAFLARGVLHAVVAPMWDGFDEPFHLALVEFVADHGRPPGFTEPSFPAIYVTANRQLPSMVGYGAPTFDEWRAMHEDERTRRRATAVAQTRNRHEAGPTYAGPNYERQQGPLFYYLAAPLFALVRSWSLPAQLVALRLFCVLIASAIVPISARFLRVTAGRAGVLVGLPLVALAPNTLFFVDRVTNDALAWPLFALALTALARCIADRGTTLARSATLGGVAITAAIWTKLTALPLLFGAIVAAVLLFRARTPKRSQAALLLVGMPLLAVVTLFAWNRSASGSWTGLAEATATTAEVPVMTGVRFVATANFWLQLASTHIWSGGWGFVQPSRAVYVLVILLIGATLAIAYATRRDGRRDGANLPLFGTIYAAFIAAIVVHAIKGALAKAANPAFPTIGAEGWYLDVLRPIEALALASVVGALRARAWAIAVIASCAVADAAGSTLLLYPRWSGGASELTFDFAPLLVPSSLVLLLVVIYAAGLSFAAGSATADRHAP